MDPISSSTVKLAPESTIVVFVALVAVLFWGALLGPIGSIVGVPMTALIKSIVLDNYAGTKWLAAALSEGDGTSKKETQQAQ